MYMDGQSLINPYTGILSIFSTRIINGNDIDVFEDGMESRDFVYIDDIVDATILGIEKKEADYEIFNVGSGNNINILEVARTLKDAYNSKVNIKVSGNYRAGDIRHNYADITKVKKKLGYKPKVNFEEGIKRFINWVKQQKVKKDLYKKSINEMKDKGLFLKNE